MSRSWARRGALAAGLVALAAPAGLHAQAVPERPASAHTPTGRIEGHELRGSEALGSRRVWVLLPPSYDPSSRYPVVYAQDGQDLFDAATAAGGEEWALDELLAARPAGIPEIFVVGVEAAPQALKDYSPPGSADGARGDLYVEFLAGVVKPFVDAHYPTRRGPEDTFVLGCGAGAVAAVYAAWTRSDTFGGAIALELPDLDAASLAWTGKRPARRPRLWIEQPGGDSAARSSATSMLDALRASAQVQYVLGSRTSERVVLAAAGLRAIFAR